MTPKETPVSLESWRIPAPKERAEIKKLAYPDLK